MARHGIPRGGADHVSSPWENLLCCEKLSGAAAVRGQLEVGQELRQMKASPLPTIALFFSLPAE